MQQPEGGLFVYAGETTAGGPGFHWISMASPKEKKR